MVLLVGSGALYTYRLDRVPPHLSLDEAHMGVHAHAIAATGRNLNGDAFPLFISLADPLGDRPVLPWGETWYQPILVYLIAGVLTVVPLSETAARLPTALIGGLVNVALVFLVARRLWKSQAVAGAAALLLALCPAHVILSRQALDYVMPLPFVLGWLWCLAACHETRRVSAAIAGGLLLGAGCYSFVTSWVLMPCYLVMALMVSAVESSSSAASASSASSGSSASRLAPAWCAGFALPLLLLVPWLRTHPSMASDILQQYQVSEAPYHSAFQAIANGEGAMRALRQTVDVYWQFFDPSFLFVVGGSSRAVSTGEVGVFLLPMALLLPVGFVWLLRAPHRSPMALVLVAGLLAAPVLAALKGTPFAIQRATTVLPFAALVAAAGFGALWTSAWRPARFAAAAALALSTLQFAGFYRDYLTDYRIRAAAAYDPTAFSGAADYLLSSAVTDRTPAIYIAAPLYDVSAKWRFYATKHGRIDLLDRTRYFDVNTDVPANAASGSLAVAVAGTPAVANAIRNGGWRLDKEVHQIAGEPTLIILRRAPQTPQAPRAP